MKTQPPGLNVILIYLKKGGQAACKCTVTRRYSKERITSQSFFEQIGVKKGKANSLNKGLKIGQYHSYRRDSRNISK
jgi:hypothetical protein